MKAWLVKWLLGNATVEERTLYTALLLDRLGALPLSDILYQDEAGTLLIGGRPVDIEKARLLRNAARNALDNAALVLIREQVAYQASVLGSTKAQTPTDLLFARAALWWVQEVEKKLRLLAQDDPSYGEYA